MVSQVCGLLTSASDIATSDIKNSKDAKKAAETRFSQLKTKVSNHEKAHSKKESKFEVDLKAERTRVEEAEKESGLLKTQVEELKKQLAEKRSEADIISEFKKSQEYDEALAAAGAPEVQRCWIISERHVKIDPYASWATFVKEIIAAKKVIEDGKGEPEPYNGPSSSFILAPPSEDDSNQN